MIHIITTVGTSIFTNYKHEDVKFELEKQKIDFSIEDAYKKLLKENNNTTYKDKIYQKVTENFLSGFSKKKIIKKNDWSERIEIKWETAENDKHNYDCCAETKTIQKIFELVNEKAKDETKQNKFKIHLICTDTALSKVAGKIIEKFYEKNDRFTIELHEPITGLQVHNPDKFKDEGINNLITKIKEIKDKDNDVILNISGGYKALIPILTIIGQLENIPLKYIYEESEALIEIGQLPVNYDWFLIETMKPFTKSYFLSNIEPLLKYVKDKEVKFKNDRFIFKNGVPNDIKKTPKELQQVAFYLLHNNLIEWNNGKLRQSYVGQLINKISLGQDKGYIMEHLLYKYFNSQKKNKIVQKYSLSKYDHILKNRFFYKNNDKVIISKEKVNNSKKIGDIDISLLKKENEIEILTSGEIKAFQATCGYADKVGKNNDYYHQLKARLLALHDENKNFSKIEQVLFVFKFVIKNVNDSDDFLSSDKFKNVFSHLKLLEEDDDLKNFANFKCYGIKIPVEFQNGKINLTNFYKGYFDNWIWEEINI